jgi:hypothetical protein
MCFLTTRVCNNENTVFLDQAMDKHTDAAIFVCRMCTTYRQHILTAWALIEIVPNVSHQEGDRKWMESKEVNSKCKWYLERLPLRSSQSDGVERKYIDIYSQAVSIYTYHTPA